MMARIFGIKGYAYYWRENEEDARLEDAANNGLHWEYSPLQAFSSDFLTRQYLVNLCSWYHSPDVLYFDSMVELFAHFNDPEWPMRSIHIRKKMQANYLKESTKVQQFYAHWLGGAVRKMHLRRYYIMVEQDLRAKDAQKEEIDAVDVSVDALEVPQAAPETINA